MDESKKDFWDSFADAGAQKSSSSIGTSAVKGGGSGASQGLMGKKKDDDNWDKW